MYPGQPNQPPSTLQDPLRVPRRQMDPEDVIEIVRRNKSWIAGPALAGLVVAVVVAFLWPDTYVSTSLVRVVPPQVPERLVPTIVNTEMSDRIQSMAQTILSRGTLTSIIETYGLYPRQHEQLPMEDIILQMQDDINITPVQTIQGGSRNAQMTAFSVSFAYENRYLAQRVAGDIVSRFINENTRESTSQAAMTTQFLNDQWQMAKTDLDELEQRLTEFRLRHAGQLPDQWPVRMQQLSAAEARISLLNGNISRLNQEKLVLEGEIRAYRDRIATVLQTGTTTGTFTDPELARIDSQLRNAEESLTRLLESYTETHPDVIRYRSQIEAMRNERERYLASRGSQAAGAETQETPPAVVSEQGAREIREANTQIQTMQTRIRAADLQIEEATREVDTIRERISDLEKQLQEAPIGEQEYTSLQRDYQLAKSRYDELNLKKSQSEIATDLEARKQGETLELLDAASLPESPTEPQRTMIILTGVGCGIALGALLVFFREMKDTSLKTLKDVRAYTQLAVLGSVPLLENDLVVMRRRRITWLAWTAACVLSTITMAGAVYYYFVTRV